MVAPNASLEFSDECNNEPSVKEDHKSPQGSEDDALQNVRLRRTKHAKRTDTDCSPEATSQNVNGWPSPDGSPVEAAQPTIAGAVTHEVSAEILYFKRTGICWSAKYFLTSPTV